MWGATSQDTCEQCHAGFYQSELGQATPTVCIPCAPGNYSVVPGAASCMKCPPGTWGDRFNATSCNVCPEGRWAGFAGAKGEDQCQRCSSADCFGAGESSARVVVDVDGLRVEQLNAHKLEDLRVAYASAISAAAGVDNDIVVDLDGSPASVTLGAEGRVSAWVRNAAGRTANDIAAGLYDAEFREAIKGASKSIAGRKVQVTSVTMAPAPFTLAYTVTETATTTTQTSTTAATTTTSAATTTTEAKTTNAAATTSAAKTSEPVTTAKVETPSEHNGENRGAPDMHQDVPERHQDLPGELTSAAAANAVGALASGGTMLALTSLLLR